MNRRFGLSVVAIVSLAVLACCGGAEFRDENIASSRSTSASDSGASSTLGPNSATGCTLLGNNCEGAISCCPPYKGRVYDSNRNCQYPSKGLACPGLASPSAGCGVTNSAGWCYVHSLDDGGTEIVLTPSQWDSSILGRSFVNCPPEQAERTAGSIPDCP